MVAKGGRKEMKKITAKTVKKGQWLSDKYSQKCVVEEKTSDRIVTRRCDEYGFWGCVAEWTYERFDARDWVRARPSRINK